MAVQITITSITGNPLFDIYVCETVPTNCIFIATISDIDLPYTFILPQQAESWSTIFVYVIDSTFCDVEYDIDNPLISPTTTPTNTPTPTICGISIDYTITYPTPTNTPTNTPTPTSTLTPFFTQTSTPTPTSTLTQFFTPTNTPTNTNTPTYTVTSTQTQTPTNTSNFIQTNTPTNTNTPTSTPTNTVTSTNTPTNTLTPTPTRTQPQFFADCPPLYYDGGNDIFMIYELDLPSLTGTSLFLPITLNVFGKSNNFVWVIGSTDIEEYDITVTPVTFVRNIDLTTNSISIISLCNYPVANKLQVLSGDGFSVVIIDISTNVAVVDNLLYTIIPNRSFANPQFIVRDSSQNATYIQSTDILSNTYLDIYDDSGLVIATGPSSNTNILGIYVRNNDSFVVDPLTLEVFDVIITNNQISYVTTGQFLNVVYVLGFSQSDTCGGELLPPPIPPTPSSTETPTPTPTLTQTSTSTQTPTPTKTPVTPTPTKTSNFIIDPCTPIYTTFVDQGLYLLDTQNYLGGYYFTAFELSSSFARTDTRLWVLGEVFFPTQMFEYDLSVPGTPVGTGNFWIINNMPGNLQNIAKICSWTSPNQLLYFANTRDTSNSIVGNIEVYVIDLSTPPSLSVVSQKYVDPELGKYIVGFVYRDNINSKIYYTTNVCPLNGLCSPNYILECRDYNFNLVASGSTNFPMTILVSNSQLKVTGPQGQVYDVGISNGIFTFTASNNFITPEPYAGFAISDSCSANIIEVTQTPTPTQTPICTIEATMLDVTNTPTPTLTKSLTPTPTSTTPQLPNICSPLYIDFDDSDNLFIFDLNSYVGSVYFQPINLRQLFARSTTKIWMVGLTDIDEYDATTIPPTYIRTISLNGILTWGAANYSPTPNTLLIADGSPMSNSYYLMDITTNNASLNPIPLFTLRSGRFILIKSFIHRDSSQGRIYVNTTDITSTDSMLEIYNDSGIFIASGDTFNIFSQSITVSVFFKNGLLYMVDGLTGSIYSVQQIGQQLNFLATPNQITNFNFGVAQSDDCSGITPPPTQTPTPSVTKTVTPTKTSTPTSSSTQFLTPSVTASLTVTPTMTSFSIEPPPDPGNSNCLCYSITALTSVDFWHFTCGGGLQMITIQANNIVSVCINSINFTATIGSFQYTIGGNCVSNPSIAPFYFCPPDNCYCYSVTALTLTTVAFAPCSGNITSSTRSSGETFTVCSRVNPTGNVVFTKGSLCLYSGNNPLYICQNLPTPTPTRTPTRTPNPTPTNTPSQSGCYITVPSPYVIGPPTPPVGPLPVAASDLNSLSLSKDSIYGAKIFAPGFNIDGSGTITNTLTTVNVWRNPATGTFTRTGPLLRSGVWNGLDPEQPFFLWLGFSVCINVPTSKTYYIGLGADNLFAFRLNGNTIVKFVQPGGILDRSSFEYWWVYPVYMNAGLNVIECYGLNQGQVARFGCEIYDNTLQQLINATNLSQLNIIFTSASRVGSTFDVVLNPDFTPNPQGYSCPDTGYYVYCSATCFSNLINCTPTPSVTEGYIYPSPTNTKTPTQTPTPTKTPGFGKTIYVHYPNL